MHPEPAPELDATLTEVVPGKLGRYTILAAIGKGASGEVFRARDPEIGRDVAIKLLSVPQGLSPDEQSEWRQRFTQEARAAGSLSHPGIVSVHDVGRADDGSPFIVMALVEGRSLETVIREGPPPAAKTVLGWGAQVAEALDAAHRLGIVHRDIKPANILIDHEGRAHIADFGIARCRDSELTRTGLFLGSPAYAAPEQLRGGPVDARADLFSLGATLYLALTGRKPFHADSLPGVAYAICHRDPVPPCRILPELPPACDRILLRALQKEPARRYETGGEMAAELRAATADGFVPRVEMTVARGVADARQLWLRGWQSGPRTRAAMITGVALLLAALWLGSILIAHRIEERRRSPGQRLKKAFRSLVSTIEPPPAPWRPS